MTTLLANKSTLEEIRTRFDQDVERFSNLETGQQATTHYDVLHRNSVFACYFAVK